MPFIHIWLLKSRKQNPGKWGLTKIAKLNTQYGITKLSSITTLLFYLSKNRSIEGKTLLLTIANTDAPFSQQSNSYIII